MTRATDTIVAIATAAGAGGVGIVRLSGPAAHAIGETLGGRPLAPRQARYARFADGDGEVIDDGIALYFRGPASFTGEDVVELQAHGSPVALQQLVAHCIALGARQARPGEFSERAFLNGKLTWPRPKPSPTSSPPVMRVRRVPHGVRWTVSSRAGSRP